MQTYIKKYGLFLISVIVIGTGITMITDTGLGTTAVTSLPYVFSRLFQTSFGTMTMWFNILWVVLQLLLLRGKFEKKQLLQFFVGPLLGISMDLTALLLTFIQPTLYIIRLIYLIAGCAVLAFGIFLQLEARAIYNPTEGIVNALADVTEKKFGNVKIAFDVTLVVLSVIVSLFAFGNITGIREGTLVSALLIGPLTNFYRRLFKRQREAATNHTK